MIFSTDYSEGFGGKYGVQSDRVDESAVGYEHKEKLSVHDSQKGAFRYCAFVIMPCVRQLTLILLVRLFNSICFLFNQFVEAKCTINAFTLC